MKHCVFILFIILVLPLIGQDLYEYKFVELSRRHERQLEKRLNGDTVVCMLVQLKEHFELNLFPNMPPGNCFLEYARQSNKYFYIGKKRVVVFSELDENFTTFECVQRLDVFNSSNGHVLIKIFHDDSGSSAPYLILW